MTVIDKYKSDIQRLCAKHKVRSLYVFGSILTNAFKPESDIDLLVDFGPIDINQYADNYFELKFALENTLDRQVDLLEEKAIENPFFRKAIENQRMLIYGYRD
jgi:hypothetical protein